MSLYLAIFDGDTEVDGWVFGHYSDFGYFRDTIAKHLEATDYPTLMNHSDCSGEWSTRELPDLKRELLAIAAEFRNRPPEAITGAFEHNTKCRKGATSLYDCFHNVDEENVFEAMLSLCEKALSCQQPILFQ